MVKLLIILILITIINVAPVSASLCRNFNEKLVCVVTVKRSAKYYWEYRVSLSIEGKKTPVNVYNCRDKFKITKDKQIIPFNEDQLGDFICNWIN